MGAHGWMRGAMDRELFTWRAAADAEKASTGYPGRDSYPANSRTTFLTNHPLQVNFWGDCPKQSLTESGINLPQIMSRTVYVRDTGWKMLYVFHQK